LLGIGTSRLCLVFFDLISVGGLSFLGILAKAEHAQELTHARFLFGGIFLREGLIIQTVVIVDMLLFFLFVRIPFGLLLVKLALVV
jgi:hypothetical protein